MRKLTGREKITIGIGALAIIIIAFYFFLWPIIFGDRSKSSGSISSLQEELLLLKKLRAMEPILSELENSMRQKVGYGDMTFKQGIADAIIMKQVAQLAAQSEIREIEQLDAKPEKTRKTTTISRNIQTALKPIVDQIYLVSLKKNPNESEPNLSEDSNVVDEKGKNKKKEAEFFCLSK